MTILGASLYEGNRKEKSRLNLLQCSFDGECELLNCGECLEVGAFLRVGCIYGRVTRTEGYTKRAYRSYKPKMRKFKEQREKHGPMPKSTKKEIATIGEWVYLGYAHISNCEVVPFKGHGGPFSLAIPFIKVEDFTPEVVVMLAAFRPRAMMGGEITSYQKKEVPRFLYHLKHQMPELYGAALELNPDIAQKTFALSDIGSVKTSIHNVAPGTKVFIKDKWCGIWDGEQITTEEKGDHGIMALMFNLTGTVSLVITPKKLEVAVCDEAEIERLWEAGLIEI